MLGPLTHRLYNESLSHNESFWSVRRIRGRQDGQDLSGLLLSDRRPLFSPIQTNLSSVLEILFALCQSQFSQFVILKYSMLDQPNPEKTNLNKVGVNWGRDPPNARPAGRIYQSEIFKILLVLVRDRSVLVRGSLNWRKIWQMNPNYYLM